MLLGKWCWGTVTLRNLKSDWHRTGKVKEIPYFGYWISEFRLRCKWEQSKADLFCAILRCQRIFLAMRNTPKHWCPLGTALLMGHGSYVRMLSFTPFYGFFSITPKLVWQKHSAELCRPAECCQNPMHHDNNPAKRHYAGANPPYLLHCFINRYLPKKA